MTLWTQKADYEMLPEETAIVVSIYNMNHNNNKVTLFRRLLGEGAL